MPSFKYQVRDSAGQVSAGVLQAPSQAEATGQLRRQGQTVLNMAAVEQGPRGFLEALRSVKIESGPGLKDVHNFTNQLAVMIKAGINIRDAIDGVGEQVPNQKFKKIILQIKDEVEAGQPFSEAIARHPKVFSPLYVNMVKASELSVNFGHMLERITA